MKVANRRPPDSGHATEFFVLLFTETEQLSSFFLNENLPWTISQGNM
jgi:hypothetical protein